MGKIGWVGRYLCKRRFLILKKVSFVVDKVWQNNLIFDRHQTKMEIRDNALDKYYAIYELFKKNNHDIATNDINSIEESDIVLYMDMPQVKPLKEHIDKSYIVLIESPLFKPDNYDVANHHYFKKIFTWHDDFVDAKKYIKINYSFTVPQSISKHINRKKLCCLIVSNKTSLHKNELYSERKKSVRWFEQNHPNDFNLYGVGWNEYFFKGSIFMRAFNRIPLAKKIMHRFFGEEYPSYKGKIANKFETMQDYKFTIAYENIKDVPGYITEKIMDPLFAGCVPIYLGANNITDYIPKTCFIDKRDFTSLDALYEYIKNMEEKRYLDYLESIEDFLKSRDVNKFKVEFFAQTLFDEIANDK